MIASLTSVAISKHEAVFGDCRSEQQIISGFNFISPNFYWPHILKRKANGMHLKNHLLRGRRLVVFPTGFEKRHDSESEKTVSPHWVIAVSPLECTWRQQVENHKNTHWIIESVLSLAWFFFEESTWRLTRKNCFSFFFLSPVGRKFSPTLLITSEKMKDLHLCQFYLFNLFNSFLTDRWSLIRWSLNLDPVIQWSLIRFFQESFNSPDFLGTITKFDTHGIASLTSWITSSSSIR